MINAKKSKRLARTKKDFRKHKQEFFSLMDKSFNFEKEFVKDFTKFDMDLFDKIEKLKISPDFENGGKYIIDNFHNLKCKNEYGQNLAHIVFKCSLSLDTIEYVIKKRIDFECEDNFGIKPTDYLFYFCEQDEESEKILRLLIDKGVKLDQRCRLNHDMPIHMICTRQNFEMVKYCIDKFEIDLNLPDSILESIFFIICKRHDFSLEQIKYFFNKNVDINCKNFYGDMPIHHICQYRRSLIKDFVENGAKIECEDRYGYKPIHHVCEYPNPEIIKYLIDIGVDLECQDPEGRRPIHYVCKFQNFETIKYLVEKNVELNCKTKNGMEPIDYLKKYSKQEIVEYLANIIDEKDHQMRILLGMDQ